MAGHEKTKWLDRHYKATHEIRREPLRWLGSSSWKQPGTQLFFVKLKRHNISTVNKTLSVTLPLLDAAGRLARRKTSRQRIITGALKAMSHNSLQTWINSTFNKGFCLNKFMGNAKPEPAKKRICFQTMTFPETSEKTKSWPLYPWLSERISKLVQTSRKAFCHRNSEFRPTFASLRNSRSLVTNSFLRICLHRLPRKASRQGPEGVFSLLCP